VGDDHALDPGHHPDTRHDRRAHVEFGAPSGQRGQLHERRVTVDQQLDPFACQQSTAIVVPLDVTVAAPGRNELQLFVQRGDTGGLDRIVIPIRLRRRIDFRRQHGHPPPLPSPVSEYKYTNG
jgi:hypothetical protein